MILLVPNLASPARQRIRVHAMVEISLPSLLSLSHIALAATPRFLRLSAPMLMSAAVPSPPLYAISLLFITALIPLLLFPSKPVQTGLAGFSIGFQFAFFAFSFY